MSAVTRHRLAHLIVAAELPALLIVSPALLFPTPRRLVVLAVVPVFWLCARIADGRSVPRTPMNAALGVMLMMVGVSLLATFDIRFSLGKVSGLVLSVLLYWAISRSLTTARRLKAGTVAFVIAGVGLAVVALLGTDFGKLALGTPAKIPALIAIAARLPPVIRGVPGAEEGFDPNGVAGVLVLFVPLQLALLAARADRWVLPHPASRWFAWLLVFIQVMLLLLTAGTVLLMQSRSAWLGLAVAALAGVLWQGWRTRVVAAGVASAVGVLVMALGPTSAAGRAMSPPGAGWTGAVAIRTQLWSSGIHGIQDFPVTGMGMNVFRRMMPIRYPTTFTGKDMAHAHNHLLQAALDLGIPGLVAYGAVWMITAVLLVAVYRRSGERIYRALAGGLGAGLIAHFMFGMADAIPLGAKAGVLFWMTLALVVGLHRVALARSPAPGEARGQGGQMR